MDAPYHISLENYRDFSPEQKQEIARAVHEAGVIRAVDRSNPANKELVYGRETLALIRLTQITDNIRVLEVGIDFSLETDELEFLCALCMAHKGCHEYQTSGPVEKSLDS